MDTAWTPETLRAFEEEVKEAFLRGEIRAPVHLAGGNEEQLIEIFKGVQVADWVCGTHRAHYHCLLKGVPREELKAAIMAGRSMHLNFPKHRIVTSAIVGGIMPIALGLAMAGYRSWAFIGDMAWECGITQECVKWAEGHLVPLHVIVECNGYSTNTPTAAVWGLRHHHINLPPIDEYIPSFETLREWGEEGGSGHGMVQRYCYDRIFPHVGAGAWVTFG